MSCRQFDMQVDLRREVRVTDRFAIICVEVIIEDVEVNCIEVLPWESVETGSRRSQ